MKSYVARNQGYTRWRADTYVRIRRAIWFELAAHQISKPVEGQCEAVA